SYLHSTSATVFRRQHARAEGFDDWAHQLVLLNMVIGHERPHLVWMVVKITECDRVLVHGTQQLHRCHTIPVHSDEENLHKIFRYQRTVEVDELFFWGFHRLN